jgi:hypothetical protein
VLHFVVLFTCDNLDVFSCFVASYYLQNNIICLDILRFSCLYNDNKFCLYILLLFRCVLKGVLKYYSLALLVLTPGLDRDQCPNRSIYVCFYWLWFVYFSFANHLHTRVFECAYVGETHGSWNVRVTYIGHHRGQGHIAMQRCKLCTTISTTTSGYSENGKSWHVDWSRKESREHHFWEPTWRAVILFLVMHSCYFFGVLTDWLRFVDMHILVWMREMHIDHAYECEQMLLTKSGFESLRYN